MSEIALINPIQAHKVLSDVWVQVKNNLTAGRKQVIELRDYEDAMTDKQRRYLHGYVLTEIAKQARPNGQAHAMHIWKEFFRKTYLGSKRISIINPMTGKRTSQTKRISTEDLGVKKYNAYIERITAFATTDLGVNFYLDIDQWHEENGL